MAFVNGSFCAFARSVQGADPVSAPRRLRRESSPRTIAAPSTIACILPKATSRGRYFSPQSGATTMRSAGT